MKAITALFGIARDDEGKITNTKLKTANSESPLLKTVSASNRPRLRSKTIGEDHRPRSLVTPLPTPIKEVAVPVAVRDLKSREYFHSQDLSRGRFAYAPLVEGGAWPDEMLLTVDILAIAYNEFINTYRSTASVFDTPIRNAIYFMNQKTYASDTAISRFLVNGDYRIPDNYLSMVIAEDNCYMREIEDRRRSPNEHKHYLLVRALEELLKNLPISDGSNVMKSDHEHAIRSYIIVYNLKNMYAIIDDTLRTILSATISGVAIGISLHDFLRDLLVDCDTQILVHLHAYHDDRLFTAVHTFRDLMLYTFERTREFRHVFVGAASGNRTPIGLLTRTLDISSQQRIEYVHRFYSHLVHCREIKTTIVVSEINTHHNFETMLAKLDVLNIERLVTPRYVRNDSGDPTVPIASLTLDVDVTNKSSPKVEVSTHSETIRPTLLVERKRSTRPRQASMDIVLRSPRFAASREDVALKK